MADKKKTEKSVTVQVIFPREYLAAIDEIAAEAGVTRSKFIRTAVELSLEDWETFRKWGLTPIRMRKIHTALVKFGLIEPGPADLKGGKDAGLEPTVQ